MKRSNNAIATVVLLFLVALSWAAYHASSKTHVSSPNSGCAVEEASVQAVQDKVHTDLQAIRGMGFSLQTDGLDQLGEVTDEEKTEFKKQFLDAAKDILWQSGDQVIATKGRFNPASLSPKNVTARINELKNLGISSPIIGQGLKKLARTGQKRASMQIGFKGTEVLADLHEVEEGVNNSNVPSEKKYEAAKTVMGWFVKEEALPLLVSSKIEIGSAYYFHTMFGIKPNIDHLAQLNEKDLDTLKELSARLQKDVKSLNESKSVLADCKDKKDDVTPVVGKLEGVWEPDSKKLSTNKAGFGMVFKSVRVGTETKVAMVSEAPGLDFIIDAMGSHSTQGGGINRCSFFERQGNKYVAQRTMDSHWSDSLGENVRTLNGTMTAKVDGDILVMHILETYFMRTGKSAGTDHYNYDEYYVRKK